MSHSQQMRKDDDLFLHPLGFPGQIFSRRCDSRSQVGLPNSILVWYRVLVGGSGL